MFSASPRSAIRFEDELVGSVGEMERGGLTHHDTTVETLSTYCNNDVTTDTFENFTTADKEAVCMCWFFAYRQYILELKIE